MNEMDNEIKICINKIKPRKKKNIDKFNKKQTHIYKQNGVHRMKLK